MANSKSTSTAIAQIMTLIDRLPESAIINVLTVTLADKLSASALDRLSNQLGQQSVYAAREEREAELSGIDLKLYRQAEGLNEYD